MRQKILAAIGYFLINAVCKTLRVKVVDWQYYETAVKQYGNVIYALWHNRLVFMPFAYRTILKRKAMVVMVSQSRDGELIGKVLAKFGVDTVRGSSSRGGTAAMKEMVRKIQLGNDGAMTPDGPRGPRYEVQPGTILLAQMTQLPIVPATYDVSRKIVLKSWDGFIVPLPFSRVSFVLGKPIMVHENANEKEKEEQAELLKETLLELNRIAEENLS